MKHIIHFLLLMLVIASIGFFALFNAQPTGNAVAVAGQTMQLQVTPTTPWGGLYGRLGEGAATQASISAGQIDSISINHYNQSCQATEIIASQNPVTLTSLEPVDPVLADSTLGLDTTNPFSITNMYTQQQTYNIEGTEIALWSTTTTGQLGNFYQGVARAGPDIVFVSNTINNGLAFNGESATYQLLLLEGTWQLQTDETDTCFEEAYLQEETNTSSELNLQVALPQRICVGQEHSLYTVDAPERTICRPSDVPTGCEPLSGVESTVRYGAQQLQQTTTDETGEILFTPQREGTHNVVLQYQDQQTRKTFSVQNCLDYGQAEQESTTITREREQLTAQPFVTEAQEQDPSDLSSGQAAYLLVVLLSMTTILGAGIVYGRLHADDNVYVLELRILWERLKSIFR